MDISNEANVDHFKIGPSSIIGRTIAFRVLFCNSISHFRHKIFHVLLNYIYRFGDFVAPMFSWFHPRNPQGILVMMMIIAFLLKRYTNVKLRAETAYRRKFWRNMMRTALTYEEWSHAAKMLDKETPKMHECDLYDEELVRNKLQELRHRRQEGCLRDIIFCMRADLVRNLGNMCNPELHKDRLQVPKLIKEYIDEVSTQLRMVCDSDSEELSLEEKLAFMHETRHAFGRTALLLSGGASLGAFHVGVVKTLVEHKLVPRIVAGSSVGSIMCAVVATRSWPELQSFFEDSWHSLQFFDQLGGIFTVVKRVMRQGVVHEIRQLQWMLRNLTSNLTFQEAYDMTGRILGITVCSPRKHEPPRCLNYLTSPHVVIWSAVTASCAFPGLFEAQELMAKDRSGEIVPYHPPFNLDPEEGSGAPMRRWRDGSLEIDLPMIQLKELFNVNHFIVSQANPHIAPLLRLKDIVRAYGGSFAAKLAHLTEMEVKHRCNQVLELGFPLGGLAKLFAQDWEGDVTVVNTATLAQYLKIIQNPTHVELQKASNQGRRCTWEKLSAIKANCGIELALDECVAVLNHMRRLKRSAERAAAASHGQASSASSLKFSASKRIPSWNCIARENSTGSLEEDLLVDVASTFHQGVGVAAGTSTGRSLRTQRNLHHDGSDSESESVDLNSWTRSGGPLMRTPSANKFTDFVQSLDVDSELTKGLVCHPNSPGAQMGDRDLYNQISRLSTPDRNSESEFNPRDFSNRISTGGSSITVTEGDLLQHERILNGFVLNVVKKEDMVLSNRVHDKENHNSEVPVGSSVAIFANRNRFIQWTSDLIQNSPTATVVIRRFFDDSRVITGNPANVQHMLKTQFYNYEKGSKSRRTLFDFLGNGIFNIDGDSWKFQRQVSSHEFNTKSLRKFVETVVDTEVSQRLIPILSTAAANNTVLDLQDILQRFAFDNICKIAFGYDPAYLLPDLAEAEFAKTFDEAARISSDRFATLFPFLWKIKRVFNIGSEKRLKEASSELREFARNIIKEKKQELSNKSSIETVDLLSRFLSSGHSDEDFVTDIVISFILAGRDTTSAALTWYFWLLSQNPEVEREILREIKEKSESPVYEEVKDMVYTHASLCESMRLYPPVPVDGKVAMQDDVLPDGTVIKKGMRVSYHPYAMGRLEMLWGPDWEKFKPERWLQVAGDGVNNNGKWSFAGRDPYSYPVFQAGPRICLGKDMAFLQMKRVVAGILRRFKVVPAAEEGFEPVFVSYLTSKMQGGFPVRFEERAN